MTADASERLVLTHTQIYDPIDGRLLGNTVANLEPLGLKTCSQDEEMCSIQVVVYQVTPALGGWYHAILNIIDCDNKSWAIEGEPENPKPPWGKLMSVLHTKIIDKREGKQLFDMGAVNVPCEKCECLWKTMLPEGKSAFEHGGKTIKYDPMGKPPITSNTVVGYAVARCELDKVKELQPKNWKIGKQQVNVPGWDSIKP